ncbi:MAG TPA: hypothetical protein VE756_12090, partial [Burkholderiales bacterium]|nr:hypothetical protein [Burkholderiales bacterium]
MLLLCMCLAMPLRAQSRVEAALGGTREIVHSRAGSGAARLAGSVLGGGVDLARGHFGARLRYGQGRVANDTMARDLAEGEALIGYMPRGWLGIWAGPHARTFIAPGLSDRRWLFWTARVHAQGAIFPNRLDGFAELWRGVSGRLSRPDVTASGGGAEFGLEARPLRGRLVARLAYRVEQGRASGFRETVEGFVLAMRYG